MTFVSLICVAKDLNHNLSGNVFQGPRTAASSPLPSRDQLGRSATHQPSGAPPVGQPIVLLPISSLYAVRSARSSVPRNRYRPAEAAQSSVPDPPTSLATAPASRPSEESQTER